jgi:hypothetical protein
MIGNPLMMPPMKVSYMPTATHDVRDRQETVEFIAVAALLDSGPWVRGTLMRPHRSVPSLSDRVPLAVVRSFGPDREARVARRAGNGIHGGGVDIEPSA